MIDKAMYDRWQHNPPAPKFAAPEFLAALRTQVLMKYTQNLLDGK